MTIVISFSFLVPGFLLGGFELTAEYAKKALRAQSLEIIDKSFYSLDDNSNKLQLFDAGFRLGNSSS